VETIKKEFSQVILIENKENRGFGKANNQGLATARGEYLMFLNTDVKVLNGAINTLVDYLDKNSSVMMVGPRLLNADMSFQHACRRNLPNTLNSFFHLFGLVKIFKHNEIINSYKQFTADPEVTGPVEAISGAAMLFRRQVYEEIGGFDERFFMYGEDLDFCKRIFDKGWGVVYVSNAKIIHFGGQSSKKRKVQSLRNFYEAMWIYYKKHFAPKQFFLVNIAVWLAIKIKLFIAVMINYLK
jgi:GT2 family glycosyltransferase